MEIKDYFSTPKLNIRGELDVDQLKDFDAQLEAITSNEPPSRVAVVVSSGGGSVSICRSLYDRCILLGQTADVWMIASGHAASAAVTLMMAVPTAQRLVTPHTQIMIHEVSRSDRTFPRAPTAISELVVEQVEFDHQLLDLDNQWTAERLADGLDRAVEEIREWLRPGRGFDAEEAVKLGFASAILGA